jgi:drug/metabolite transporter (DMT)-like permease
MGAALALLVNAAVWGLSWIPFKSLAQAGLHPLWSTALIYLGSTVVMIYLCRQDLMRIRAHPAVMLLGIAAGLTNACFNTAVALGDVVRVILLFYLMPIWAVLFARILLKEPLTLQSAAKITLGLAGAAVILGGRHVADFLPKTLPDVLAIAGGALFALNNVMLRKLRDLPGQWGTLAMVTGACVMNLLLAIGFTTWQGLHWPDLQAPGVLHTLLLWSLLFMGANACLQYGASRLAPAVTAVLMLSEIVFGSVSAWALGEAVIGPRELTGGGLILLAAMLPSGGQAGRPVEQCTPQKLL